MISNKNMPAMPLSGDAYQDFADYDGTARTSYNPQCQGLTKREIMAKDMDVKGFEFSNIESMEAFIGCKVDQSSIVDIIKSQAKCNANLKVMFADALLEELERTK